MFHPRQTWYLVLLVLDTSDKNICCASASSWHVIQYQNHCKFTQKRVSCPGNPLWINTQHPYSVIIVTHIQLLLSRCVVHAVLFWLTYLKDAMRTTCRISTLYECRFSSAGISTSTVIAVPFDKQHTCSAVTAAASFFKICCARCRYCCHCFLGWHQRTCSAINASLFGTAVHAIIATAPACPSVLCCARCHLRCRCLMLSSPTACNHRCYA